MSLLSSFFEESAVEEEVGCKRPRKEKTMIRWREETVYINSESARSAIKTEMFWYIRNHNKLLDGERVIYKCNYVRGKKCPATTMLFYPANSEQVIRHSSDIDHEHTDNDSLVLTAPKRRRIEELQESGLTAQQIQYRLIDDGLFVPNLTSIQNCVSRFKKAKFGSASISIGEFDDWCQKFSAVPSDENEAYVVAHEVENAFDYDTASVRAVIATKKMLKVMESVEHLHVDSTYKTNWSNLPVIVIGTTDQAKRFYPLALGITTTESTQDYEYIFNSLKNVVETRQIK